MKLVELALSPGPFLISQHFNIMEDRERAWGQLISFMLTLQCLIACTSPPTLEGLYRSTERVSYEMVYYVKSSDPTPKGGGNGVCEQDYTG